MTELKTLYATYYSPSNANLGKQSNFYNFGKTLYSEVPHNLTQDHKNYSGTDYQVALNDVFGRSDEHSQEPVGQLFFSEKNIKRLQKAIKTEIYNQSNHRYVLDEEQDTDDLLVNMRGVYMMNGKFLKTNIVHQVKELNKKLVSYVVPDMISEIKQYYGYLKDINEPLKPIDRPMNVSNAGRRTLPSVTTTWSI